MELFAGKKGIIMGVANEHSIAWGIAETLHKLGARLGFSHLPDKDEKGRMARRVQRTLEPIKPELILPCDVASDVDVATFFERVKDAWGSIDFLVHSIAFAPIEDIRCATLDVSRDGFCQAMDISVYSFISAAREAAKIMNSGGAMLTLSYYGGEKVIAGYNLMGLCKSALETATQYLAYDLGSRNIRVNAISAGPVKTLAAAAIGQFSQMLKINAAISPLGRNITPEEIGKAAAYLLSDLSSATTGEILHVDCGYHMMGSFGRALETLSTPANS